MCKNWLKAAAKKLKVAATLVYLQKINKNNVENVYLT